jgi:hypothetical protein
LGNCVGCAVERGVLVLPAASVGRYVKPQLNNA